MNGVHCHTSAATTDVSGISEIQSGCGALAPKMPRNKPLKRP